MNKKELYYQRKAEGICTHCGKNNAKAGISLCPKCSDKQALHTKKWNACYKQQRKETYNQRKKDGICVNCGKDEAMIRSVLCPECADKQSISGKKRYDRHKQDSCFVAEYRENKNKYHREQYLKRKEAGMCVRCGKRSARSRETLCIDCSTVRKIRRRIDIPRSERPSFGLCFICGEPVKDSFRLCQKHYEVSCKNAEYGRSRVNRDNHWWKTDNNLIFR